MPHALENQRMGQRGVEICPLPAMLSPGFEHLERAILSSSPLDCDSAALRRDSLSLPRMPLQFRQLPGVQGKAQLACRRDGAGYRRAFGSEAPCKLEPRVN
jgi:hypothetical protein